MTVSIEKKREATLWVALCKAAWRCEQDWDRRLAGYRNGLLDAWCIVTGEDFETAIEKLQESLEAMKEGLASV